MKEDKRKVRRIVYEIGMRFNNFIIVDKADTLKTDFGRTYTRWKCLCDCGKEFLGTTKSIKKGKKSCGCLSIENQYKKLPAEIVMINIKYGHYISCAKRRNLDWNLNIEQFTDIVKNSCYYCGSIGSIKLKRYEFSILVNGIDRMDNNIGYNIDNVVTCCTQCNRAKNAMLYNDFIQWLDNLAKFRIEKNNIL
jgi:5-methylcytosine-specific restriction endonuclease McrA